MNLGAEYGAGTESTSESPALKQGRDAYAYVHDEGQDVHGIVRKAGPVGGKGQC